MKHRGLSPREIRAGESRVAVSEDIKGRVQRTIKTLNEDRNASMQIPKSIQANVKAYEGYEFKGEQESSVEVLNESEDIFLDTKKIQEEARKNERASSAKDSKAVPKSRQANALRQEKFEIADQLEQVQGVIEKQE